MKYNAAIDAEMLKVANLALSRLGTNALCFIDETWNKVNNLSEKDNSLDTMVKFGFVRPTRSAIGVTYSFTTA